MFVSEHPPGGRGSGGAARERSERATGERSEPVERRSRRKRGPAPDPEARPSEGAPTGATDLFCGGGVEHRPTGGVST